MAEQFPLEKLAWKREFVKAGLVNKFAQEYMNDARDISDALRLIEYSIITIILFLRISLLYLDTGEDIIPVNIYIGVDIATATQKSDYQVILVLMDKQKNRYVLEYFRERIPTFDLPEKIIKLCKKYQPVKRVTIETVAQEMVRDMVTRMAHLIEDLCLYI